jgi:predicted nucleic acid-binding protein
MNWLLDTDVLSQPAKKNGNPKVIAWLQVEKDRCYTRSMVIAQLAYWVRAKEGRQRQALQGWLIRLIDSMQGRILGFNASVVHVWADQEHLFEKAGVRMPVEDGYIAAIRPPSRFDHRNWKREGFPTSRTQGFQHIQGRLKHSHSRISSPLA